jgi:chorismate-pyruvate lyase
MAHDGVRHAPLRANGWVEGSSLSRDDPALSVLQRVLLTTDGTVTHILEAYGRERVEVAKLAQSLGDLPVPAAPGVAAVRKEKVLRRSILLRGSKSGTNYLYAESVIMADRLEPSVRLGLILTNKSIGRLLVENRTEAFRDIVATLISRTYHVVARERPIMTITEKFPTTSFV